jgi:hypothetical protein
MATLFLVSFAASCIYKFLILLCILRKDMESLSKETAAYNDTIEKDTFGMYYQSVINLTSNVINPTSLDGEAMMENPWSCCEVIPYQNPLEPSHSAKS